ncbi:MAG: thiamine-phosphate kinase [Wenzhouxiangellaceae bacterium]|nr:thiamine-phosphate kinase [Wenzhouxiangellaceae bacterium]
MAEYLSEFDLIERIRARAEASSGDGVVLGIGDDAAVLAPSPGMQLVATTDALVEARHFRPDSDPADLGHLALAVNLSDLAAMGALPRWCLLALTLPDADPAWLDGFLDGALALADTYNCALVGGNLARGPRNIAITALGEVETGQAITRSGARTGDRIVVTGTLGDAAAALKLDAADASPLGQRLLRPTPRLAAGRALASCARSLIDISDGLLADLAHLLAPDQGARIDCGALPASAALRRALPDPSLRWPLQLAGGGDYELLAAVPVGAELPERVDDTRLHVIGEITSTRGIHCIAPDGTRVETGRSGWDHFGTAP